MFIKHGTKKRIIFTNRALCMFKELFLLIIFRGKGGGQKVQKGICNKSTFKNQFSNIFLTIPFNLLSPLESPQSIHSPLFSSMYLTFLLILDFASSILLLTK